MQGGELKIAWHGEEGNVLMTGPARIVFEGEIDIPGGK
jgi:diaminopimelate epimerase